MIATAHEERCNVPFDDVGTWRREADSSTATAVTGGAASDGAVEVLLATIIALTDGAGRTGGHGVSAGNRDWP